MMILNNLCNLDYFTHQVVPLIKSADQESVTIRKWSLFEFWRLSIDVIFADFFMRSNSRTVYKKRI